jgi:hypothetical protein
MPYYLFCPGQQKISLYTFRIRGTLVFYVPEIERKRGGERGRGRERERAREKDKDKDKEKIKIKKKDKDKDKVKD